MKYVVVADFFPLPIEQAIGDVHQRMKPKHARQDPLVETDKRVAPQPVGAFMDKNLE
jgi:hypothetical protein